MVTCFTKNAWRDKLQTRVARLVAEGNVENEFQLEVLDSSFLNSFCDKRLSPEFEKVELLVVKRQFR